MPILPTKRIGASFIKKIYLRKSAKSALISVLFIFFFFANFNAQDLPKEIRGYKVYKADVTVKSAADESNKKEKSDVFVNVGEPKVIGVSITGITLEVSAEIDSIEQSGTIDLLAFKNFQANDLAVEIEEYKESFEIKKNQPAILPKPIKIFINTAQTLRGAFDEWRDSKDEWTIAGRIFVFGRFKKFGFNFKRVVPVDINLKIKNPLKTIIK